MSGNTNNLLLKKFENKYKIIIILILIILICVSSKLITSARYVSENLGGSGEVNIAKWSIKLIDGSTQHSATQGVNFIVDDDSNVLNGHIAPGISARAEVILDPTGSQVPIDYTVSIDTSNSNIPGLVIESITAVIGSNNQVVSHNTNSYSGSLTLDQVESNTIISFKIVATWENNDKNDEIDTLIGKNGQTITMPITITAQQHID